MYLPFSRLNVDWKVTKWRLSVFYGMVAFRLVINAYLLLYYHIDSYNWSLPFWNWNYSCQYFSKESCLIISPCVWGSSLLLRVSAMDTPETVVGYTFNSFDYQRKKRISLKLHGSVFYTFICDVGCIDIFAVLRKYFQSKDFSHFAFSIEHSVQLQPW